MRNFLVFLLALLPFHHLFSQNINGGLIACYPFSGDANDQSGMLHHGVVYGATLTTDRFGVANNAYEFDGIDDYIDIGSLISFTSLNEFSISVWIKPVLVKSQTILMVNADDFNDRLNAMAYYSHNGTSATIWDFGDCTTNGRLLEPNTIFSNAWQHYVYTVSPFSGMRVYKNGVLQTSQPNSSVVVNRMRNIFIGGGIDWSLAPFYFQGKIDDLRLYERELLSVEAQLLYNTPVLCGTTSLASKNDDDIFDVISQPGKLLVQLSKSVKDASFRLISSTGKLLFEQSSLKGGNKISINTSSFPAGVMLYSVKNLNQQYSGKVFNAKY